MDTHRYFAKPKFPNEPAEYQRKYSRVTAMLITDDNIEKAARWCGGEIYSEPENTSREIKIPSLTQPNPFARIGQYLIRGPLGRFEVMEQEEFEDLFVRIGLNTNY